MNAGSRVGDASRGNAMGYSFLARQRHLLDARAASGFTPVPAWKGCVDRCNRRTRISQGPQCLDTTVGSKVEIGKGFNTRQETLRLNKSRTMFLWISMVANIGRRCTQIR